MRTIKRLAFMVFIIMAAMALLPPSPSEAGVRYTYDANNRLIQVVNLAEDASKSYLYDAVGNRLEAGYGLYLHSSPAAHDFGLVLNETQSDPQTFTVTNRMSISIPVDSVHIGNNDFVIISDTCTGVTLSPGGTCTFEAAFDSGHGDEEESDQVEFHVDYATGALLYVPLRGRGGQPNVGSSENSLNFGDVAIGDTSASQSVTVINVGGTYPLEISSVYISGGDSENFVIIADACTGESLEPDTGSCTIDVAAAPRYDHLSSAKLSVTSNDPNTKDLSNLRVGGVWGPDTQVLTMQVSQGAGYIVAMPPNTWCGSYCQEGYALDVVVTLDAVPALGYYFNQFTRWNGDCTGDGICTIVMDDHKEVNAEFKTTVAYPSIAAGKEHTIALMSDGTVWAWGDNTYGQLGVDPSVIPYSETPVQVPGLSNINYLAAGHYHSMALKKGGDVYVWGDNSYGQLGDGTTNGSYSPIQINAVKGSSTIAAGSYHSLALKSDQVYAWGLNSSGQVGNNSTTDSLLPVKVTKAQDPTKLYLNNITAIDAGVNHSIALENSGEVWTWGDNTDGQLGDASVSPRTSADMVPNLTNITGIAAGAAHSLALEGTIVHAWGDNTHGQLGDNTGVSSSSPVQLTGIQDISKINAGNYHTVVLKTNGEIWVWGLNDSGQLGNGTQDDSLLPIQVFGITDAGEVYGGAGRTIVLLNDGTLMLWGLNDKGQLGDGTTTSPQLLPVPGQIDLN